MFCIFSYISERSIESMKLPCNKMYTNRANHFLNYNTTQKEKKTGHDIKEFQLPRTKDIKKVEESPQGCNKTDY